MRSIKISDIIRFDRAIIRTALYQGNVAYISGRRVLLPLNQLFKIKSKVLPERIKFI